MRVSAKVDYALLALAELAVTPPGPVKAEQLATAQEIPGAAAGLRGVWIELRTSMRGVLEQTSLADLVSRAGSRDQLR